MGETSFEFVADFPSFRPNWACLWALALAVDALMPAAPAKSVYAPSTNWKAQTSPAVGLCFWPIPGNAFYDARTDT